MPAFNGLVDSEISRIASAGEIRTMSPNEVLTLPDDPHTPFYMVLSGKIQLNMPVSRDQHKERMLKAGEFFGADLLLFGRVYPQSAIALSAVQLFLIPSSSLEELLRDIPRFRQGLIASMQTSRLIQNKHFRWIEEDEIVHLVLRKHPAYLLVSLTLPVLIGWISVVFFATAISVSSAAVQMLLEWIGGLILSGAFLFGFWRWVDWGNDYYVITDQRVVWLEQIIGLYDSRQESPLTAIKSTLVRTGLLGRAFGYGDVVAMTFLGQIKFQHIPQPELVKALLDQCQQRAVSRQVKADAAVVEQVILKKIEPPAEEVSPVPSEEAEKRGSSLSFWTRLANYFKTRVEEGDVITYRKHVYILVTKTALPSLAILVLLVLMGFVLRERFLGVFQGPLMWITFLILLAGLFAAFLWWLYHYIDWRNDIYQITSEKVIDSKKKPLGEEVTKSAPLDNIQSLDYERRGILGILLNLGNVIINVGTESKLIFLGIHDPARAQQDIFNRMYETQRKRQFAESTKQLEQFTDWLAMYHRQMEERRKSQNPSENLENSDKI